MRRTTVVIGLAVTFAAVGGGAAIAGARSTTDASSERQQEAAYTAAHIHDAAVSQEQAVATATRLHPGRVTDVHLQDEGDGLRWEVKPDDGREVREVQIDAQSGRIVGDQPDE